VDKVARMIVASGGEAGRAGHFAPRRNVPRAMSGPEAPKQAAVRPDLRLTTRMRCSRAHAFPRRIRKHDRVPVAGQSRAALTKSTRWTGAGRDLEWSNPSNWSNGVPTAGEYAVVQDGRSWLVSLRSNGVADQVGDLRMTGGRLILTNGELDFSPAARSNAPSYDLELSAGAALTVASGAKLAGRQTMLIGGDGSAVRLDVEGVVSEEYALVHGGELVVSGKGRWTSGTSGIEVGGTGDGALVVESGGQVSGGPNGFSNPAAALQLGDGFGKGSADILGSGSRVALTDVYVGAIAEGYSGALTIAGGGVVNDEVGVVAPGGDGYVVIDGKGSRWTNLSSLSFGQTAPTVSSLTVTHGGELDWGGAGFGLYDTLAIDGSAILHGKTIFDGGEIDALSGGGAVEVTQQIDIASNWLFAGQELASVSGAQGAKLTLAGPIEGDAASTLRIGAGDVAVAHRSNHYGSTEIYAAVLEVGAQGALGAGAVEFVGGKHAATLQIDPGVNLLNAIQSFGAADTIDLLGFKFAPGVEETWTPNAHGAGGTLTLQEGRSSATLHFADTFARSSFVLSADASGGTSVKLG